MASHGFDPGNPNKWYQSPHLGLIPVGYGGEIAGNCYNHSPVGASYHSVTNFTHPNSYPPPHHFTQPNPYPPPQNNYYAPPPYHFTQPHSNPPPQHSATLINGHLFPLRFPCASQTQAQYHSPHMQPTHSLAPQRLTTTTPQIPSIPSYYTPHPNSNLQIRPPISPNSSVEPLVVHSHLWRARCKQVALESTAATGGVKKPSRSRLGTVLPRKTCNSQKRYQLLMSKPKFQRLLGAITQDVKTGLRFHGSYVEQPETMVKLKGSGKLLSPKRGSSKVSHKERTNDKLSEMRESLKRSMDTFMSGFKEELRLLMGSWKSPARRVDNPQKFVSPPQSSIPESIPATTGGSSSLIAANDGSQADMCLKSGSLPHTSVDLIAATIDGNPVRISTNTGLNLWQHEVGFISEISTKPVASDISTSTGEILSLNNDINVIVVSGSNCEDGISTCMTDKLNHVSNMMGASFGSREDAIQSTEGPVVTVKLIGRLQDDRELKETQSVTAKHDEMTSEYGRDDEVDPPDKEHTDGFDGSENDVNQPVFNENLNMPQSTHFSRGTIVSSYMHDLEASRQLDVCSHKSSLIPKDLDSKEAIKIVNEHIKDCTRPPDDFQVDDLCATYKICFEFPITFSEYKMEKELPVNFHEYRMKLRCLAAAQDKLKEAGTSDMIVSMRKKIVSCAITLASSLSNDLLANGTVEIVQCFRNKLNDKLFGYHMEVIKLFEEFLNVTYDSDTEQHGLIQDDFCKEELVNQFFESGHFDKAKEVLFDIINHSLDSIMITDNGLLDDNNIDVESLFARDKYDEMQKNSGKVLVGMLEKWKSKVKAEIDKRLYLLLRTVCSTGTHSRSQLLLWFILFFELGNCETAIELPSSCRLVLADISQVIQTSVSQVYTTIIFSHQYFPAALDKVLCDVVELYVMIYYTLNAGYLLHDDISGLIGSVMSSLVDIYSHSGTWKHAYKMYNCVWNRGLIFGPRGHGKEAIDSFKRLLERVFLISLCFLLKVFDMKGQMKPDDELGNMWENICLSTGSAIIHELHANFLSTELVQLKHKHQKCSAATVFVLISVCQHCTDHKQEFEKIARLVEIKCSNNSNLTETNEIWDAFANISWEEADLTSEENEQPLFINVIFQDLDFSIYADDNLDILFQGLGDNSLAALHCFYATILGMLNTNAGAFDNTMASLLISVVDYALVTSLNTFLIIGVLLMSLTHVMDTLAAWFALFDIEIYRYINDQPSRCIAKNTGMKHLISQYNASCWTTGQILKEASRLEVKPIL